MSTPEKLLSQIRAGIEHKFRTMSAKDSQDFFDNMSPSELKGYSEMVFRQSPVNVDLEENRLSFISSFQCLPGADDLSKSTMLAKLELKRVSRELVLKRGLYERLLKRLTSNPTSLADDPKNADPETMCLTLSLPELRKMMHEINVIVRDLFDYVEGRKAIPITADKYIELFNEAVGNAFNLKVESPYDMGKPRPEADLIEEFGG